MQRKSRIDGRAQGMRRKPFVPSLSVSGSLPAEWDEARENLKDSDVFEAVGLLSRWILAIRLEVPGANATAIVAALAWGHGVITERQLANVDIGNAAIGVAGCRQKDPFGGTFTDRKIGKELAKRITAICQRETGSFFQSLNAVGDVERAQAIAEEFVAWRLKGGRDGN